MATLTSPAQTDKLDTNAIARILSICIHGALAESRPWSVTGPA